MAVAFERLALVSQVSGPDMLSPTDHWDASNRGRVPAGRASGQAGSPIPMLRQFPAKMLGLVLALLVLTAVIGVIGVIGVIFLT